MYKRQVKYYGNDQHGQNIQDPLHTGTAKDREGLTTVHLVKMKGTNLGGPATEPVQTITDGGGHHGVVTTKITRAEPGADLRHWPEIRELLNTYCGYDLGPDVYKRQPDPYGIPPRGRLAGWDLTGKEPPRRQST